MKDRDVQVRGIIEEDLPWIYAAYLEGALKHFEEGLSKSDFIDAFMDMAQRFDEVYVGLSLLHDPGGKRHAQIVPMVVSDANFSEHRMEAHATWFPWATRRNTLEIAVKFFVEVRQEAVAILPIRRKDKSMFEHLCKYALLRRVGTIFDYWSDGEEAMLFQTKRPWADV